MTHIRITFNYEPDLSHYPDEVKTKADAMRFDVAQVEEGNYGIDDFIGDRDIAMEVIGE